MKAPITEGTSDPLEPARTDHLSMASAELSLVLLLTWVAYEGIALNRTNH
jgi:hypothetical protein